MNQPKQITFSYEKRLQNETVQTKLLQLLSLCDDDFEPTLSSSRLKEQKHATKEDKLKEYLREKKESHGWLFIWDEENLIGFVNFESFDGSDEAIVSKLKEKEIKGDDTLFIDTMAFLPQYRKQGFGQQLYHEFENIVFEKGKKKIVLRSASMNNETQMHLFQKQGYRLLYEARRP